MPNENKEGVAPGSLEAEALAQLQNEGHTVGDHQPVDDDGSVKDTTTEEAPVEETKPDENPSEPAADEEPKADEDKGEGKEGRPPRMVETWKLKTAESQKEAALKRVAELEALMADANKKGTEMSQGEQDEIDEEVKKLAEEGNIDPIYLNKLVKVIQSKGAPAGELSKRLQELEAERALIKEEAGYANEFEQDILPLVNDKNLSDAELTQLKAKLKDLAFSETYAKVPLNKIFRAEQDALGIPTARRSSEGARAKVRGSDAVVDLDNLNEEQFKNLSPEQLEQFEKRRTNSGWNHR